MTTRMLKNNFDQPIENSIKLDADRFESLLVSNQNLIRCDFGSDNTRGLYDPNARVRYFIHEHDLFVSHPKSHHFDLTGEVVAN